MLLQRSLQIAWPIAFDLPTASGFRLRWENVIDNYGYVIQYRLYDYITSQWISVDVPTNQTEYIFTNLEANTKYSVRISPKCSNGNHGVWVGSTNNPFWFFETHPNCPNDIILQEGNRGNPNFDYLEFNYNANNNIFSSVPVNLYSDNVNISLPIDVQFSAGNSVVLEPGFSVDNDNKFRAHIETCTSSRSSSKSEEKGGESAIHFEVKEILKTYPNPIENLLHIDSTEAIKGWTLTNQIGSVHLNGITDLNNQKKATINTDHLAIGVYFLRVTLLSSEVITKIIIKE